MLIKPPPVTQPQTNVEKPQGIINNTLEANKNNAIIDEERVKTTELKPINNNQENAQIIIRKKRAYKGFIRLLKQGKYTNAILASKILGVDRQTIQHWLNTPLAMKSMDNELNTYIGKIQSSKDWKAQAYLLDKTLGDDDKQSPSLDIQNIILIKR